MKPVFQRNPVPFNTIPSKKRKEKKNLKETTFVEQTFCFREALSCVLELEMVTLTMKTSMNYSCIQRLTRDK